MKKTKKGILSFLIAITLISSTITSYAAIDKRITASNVGIKISGLGVSASGSTTSSTRHYTSVQLCFNQGGVAKSSGRKWGTGKVSASTGTYEDGTLGVAFKYHGRVYYGFE
jgi:hypothetical protein